MNPRAPAHAKMLAACALVVASLVARVALAEPRARVVVLDDGEKIARDARAPLDDGPWPAGVIDLFALRSETVALQVVVEAGDERVDDVRVIVEPFVDDDGRRLAADVSQLVERFVAIARASGNEREPGSLAFTAKSAPRESYVGAFADPLVPVVYETARAEPHQRAAVWIDLDVPEDARPATYRSTLLVRDADGELAARSIELRVQSARLPYAAAPAFTYYDTRELTRRMGSARAEPELRALLHAHRLGAIHDVNAATLDDSRAIRLDHDALTGEAYAHGNGYRGAGAGVGEGVFAFGAYGSLGAPGPASIDAASRVALSIFSEPDDVIDPRPFTASFLYAVDEDCASDWPAAWEPLVHASQALRGVRVAATCGDDASAQSADLVMQAAFDYDPARARVARETRGKWVWAYNGRRPSAGPMMLDVPATDLRANAWIAMRYGVERWFYWESTFWFDGNRGGRGGERGYDPFVVAETFHNADGDHANGDGILVYPGTQQLGMTDYGVVAVFPSVRLENLRRGIEDAGYIALARAVDRERADAVVRRMIPRALAFAGDRAAWPESPRAWLDARRELAAILASDADGASHGERVSESCAVALSSVGVASAPPWSALFVLYLVVRVRVRRGLEAK